MDAFDPIESLIQSGRIYDHNAAVVVRFLFSYYREMNRLERTQICLDYANLSKHDMRSEIRKQWARRMSWRASYGICCLSSCDNGVQSSVGRDCLFTFHVSRPRLFPFPGLLFVASKQRVLADIDTDLAF